MKVSSDACTLELLPAVDVEGGHAVRLVQGEAGSATSYGDPLEAAMKWQQEGAEWIHLVDLDAAFGRGHNRDVLKRVVEQMDVRIELSGGIRDDESLERALEFGAARVNLGTAALEDPEWTARVIEKHGDAIAVGLDVRGETLAARGWTQEGGNLWEVLQRLEDAGCPRYVVTDVTKDGTLRGPNTDLLAEVCRRTEKPVVASGASRPRGHRRPGPAGLHRCGGRDHGQGPVRGPLHSAGGARDRPQQRLIVRMAERAESKELPAHIANLLDSRRRSAGGRPADSA